MNLGTHSLNNSVPRPIQATAISSGSKYREIGRIHESVAIYFI